MTFLSFVLSMVLAIIGVLLVFELAFPQGRERWKPAASSSLYFLKQVQIGVRNPVTGCQLKVTGKICADTISMTGADFDSLTITGAGTFIKAATNQIGIHNGSNGVVLQLLNNVDAHFQAPGFKFSVDYPKWQ